MIDFHSHILPGMDDGSASVEESVKMLRLSFRKGVKKMVATPHFYAQRESPDHFLARRKKACRRLAPALEEEIPEIFLGAEVYYYTGISGTENLSKLCIGRSGILLLEMPFQKWTERMINEVIELAGDLRYTVLLAHIDRYFRFQPPETWELLMKNEILFQVNASAFLEGWTTRRRAFGLLREGKIAALGSDCHNMKERKPNLDEAVLRIRKKCGEKTVRQMNEKSERLLADGWI